MSETKHLYICCEIIVIERYVFLGEYHKEQDIYAPFLICKKIFQSGLM